MANIFRLFFLKKSLLYLFLLLTNIALANPIKVVVIDAGHGGNDPGAVGTKGTFEKDVNLSVALKLGALIQQHYSDVKVIYTRSKDVAVALHRRAEIANQHHADLFISIHCNSSDKPNAYGTETFVMGLDKSNANLAIAQKENAAILKEADYEQNYGGFDPSSPEAYVIFELIQDIHREQSIKFASKVQKHLCTGLSLLNRGVKEAPFLVLYRTATPSVLIELGFLSNANEEAYLASEKGQNELSKAVFNAFSELAEERNTQKKEAATPTTQVKETAAEVKIQPKNNEVTVVEAKIIFCVQFAAVTAPQSSFKGVKNIKEHKEGNYYKYTSGNETTYEGAVLILNDLKEKGYKDAFIIAFENGKKISVKEAREKSKIKNK